jgi:hypothetical protein
MKQVLRDAIASGREEEVRRAESLINAVENQIDVGETLGREELDTYGRDAKWTAYRVCEVTPGAPNPVHMPFRIFGPGEGQEVEDVRTLRFIWQYERPVRFQVARDAGFCDVVFDGTAKPSDALLPFEKRELPNGRYYWRLRGEWQDGAGVLIHTAWAPCSPKFFTKEKPAPLPAPRKVAPTSSGPRIGASPYVAPVGSGE